jgi:hypothetical protein
MKPGCEQKKSMRHKKLFHSDVNSYIFDALKDAAILMPLAASKSTHKGL